MTSRPGLASSTTRVLLAESLVVPSGLATAAYLGRTLGPELYGLFSVATTISITLEWIIISLFGRTTVKLISETSDWRPVASTILLVHLAMGLAMAIAFWAGADVVAHALGDQRLGPWFAILAFELPIASMAAACRNIMIGRGDYRGRAVSTAVRWILRPIAIVVFVEAGWSVTGAVIGSLVAATCGWAVAAAMARVPLFTAARTPIAHLWRLALPIFVLAVSLRLIDKLGLFAIQALGGSPMESGWYAAAQNFAIAPGLFALSFSPILLAELTRTRAQGQPEVARVLVSQSLRVVVALLPLAAAGAGSAHEIVRLVYGNGFDAAARLSLPLLAAAYAMLVTSVATAVLIASDHASVAATCVWPTLPLTVLALLVVVPDSGGLGAAVVTAAAVAASAVAAVAMVGVTVGVWPPGGTAIRSVAIALVVGVLATWWPAPGLWVIGKLAVLTAIVPLLFALAGEFRRRGPGTTPSTGHTAQDSGPYWDRVAADWQDARASSVWRAHSDAVNLAACRRWWPTGGGRRVLKTDVFDEVAGRGLLPDLGELATSVIAIDRSVQAARMAHRRAGTPVVGADVRQLPFVGGAFDVVVSNSTLDHFEDAGQIASALAEIHRVLAPGGRLILTLDNPANPVVALRNALPFAALHRVGLVPYFVGATLDASGAERLLSATGFAVKDTTALMHCPRALAVAIAGMVGRTGSTTMADRLRRWLMAFERLERWPLRQRTGYFVALVADKELV